MSKIAILTDIHANLPAFVAVLRDVQASGAEQVVFLGDIVGYGASPAECVDWVRKLGGDCVMGNHDVEISAVRKRGGSFRDPGWKNNDYQAGLAHAVKCLNASQADWLAVLSTSAVPKPQPEQGGVEKPVGFGWQAVDGKPGSISKFCGEIRHGSVRVPCRIGPCGKGYDEGFPVESQTAEWIGQGKKMGERAWYAPELFNRFALGVVPRISICRRSPASGNTPDS